MRVRQRGLLQGLLALVVAAACGGDSSVGTISATPSPTAQASSTPTPQVTPTPALPSPTPHAVLDDRFGFLFYKAYANQPISGPVGWKVRRESDPQPLYTLHTGSAGELNVSPDGRHVAYWSANQLRVLDISPTARPRTLLTLPSTEGGSSYMAWSNDGTGLVIGVSGGGGGFTEAPPGFGALRVIDVAGGQPREIVRVPNTSFVPLAWDRQAHVIAAWEPVDYGTRYVDTVTESGTIKRVEPGYRIYFPLASDDAKQVLATNHVDTPPPFGSTTLLRVWPAGSFASGVELKAPPGQIIRAAAWRPGTSEIGVLFDDHLEFWKSSGERRSVALPSMPPLPATNPNATLLFRADGKAVLIGRQVDTSATNTYVLAVDIASGQTAVVDWPGGLPEPGTSVRLGPTQ